MALRIKKGKITTTGSAGSATGNVSIPVTRGSVLKAVDINYHASCPATADVTFKEGDSSGRTLVTISNNATDIVWTPVGKLNKDASWADATADMGNILIEADFIWVGIAQADALTDCAIVKVGFE